jgi:hypothetical protein
LRDRDVIDAFVAHRTSTDLPELRVERRPDEENRGTPDIDAVAGPLAIEHTSIDTVTDQRRDGFWFRQVVEPIETELKLDYRLDIIFPYEGVSREQDWTAMRSSLTRWIREQGPQLSDGHHEISVVGIPFPFSARKSSEAGRKPGVWFGRYSPTDQTLPARLGELVSRKVKKLAAYADQGMRTVLIVESDDVALMNKGKLHEAIARAFPQGLPIKLHELWYADSSAGNGSVCFEDFSQSLAGDGTL